jgi:hypothetical protein
MTLWGKAPGEVSLEVKDEYVLQQEDLQEIENIVGVVDELKAEEK